ncbi:MAG: antitoxin PHD [Spirochaetales bacterium]|jgi:PHD/YefM family antitoxin component YafN of YafNO toxin-antitoxin module|nr:antitoxin PHD [Spirochaetales bacterium]
MPNICPAATLGTSYKEISRYCHETGKPVFVTDEGRGDLAVMSMENYEKISDRFELYSLLMQGLEDVRAGRTYDAYESLNEIKKEIGLI